ncbi:MAG: DUF61 family protein [Desulfurococcales archaeon]|jgi:uncharacterized protein (UPF0216 family)|nr:DUF61 family protein [Desulfurococcales archaeon]
MEMQRDPIKSYYKELVRSFSGTSPKDRKRLSELISQEAVGIELVGGGLHIVLGSEARDLASIIPRELHSEIRFPMIVAKISGTPFFKLLDCSAGVAMMLERLKRASVIEGIYSDKCILSNEDVRSLIKRYKTLFIISIIYEGYERFQDDEG